jgi:hypothetical protein
MQYESIGVYSRNINIRHIETWQVDTPASEPHDSNEAQTKHRDISVCPEYGQNGIGE